MPNEVVNEVSLFYIYLLLSLLLDFFQKPYFTDICNLLPVLLLE